jgi:hypothetical protein
MDTKNIYSQLPKLSLDKTLQSYNVLITALFFLFILIGVLFMLNPKGFSFKNNYELLITIPIMILLVGLIKEVFVLKNNPQQSAFKMFSQYQEKWFIPFIIISILIIGIGALFTTLYIGGIFSSNPPENNIPVLINIIIIFAFVAALLVIYNSTKKRDDLLLSSIPYPIQDAYNLRTKYTIMFAIFLLTIMTLYFLNPYGLMTKYGGSVIFITLFIGIVFALMITIYQYFLANDSKIGLLKDSPGFISFLFKGGYILASLGISGLLIYWLLKSIGIFNQDASKPETWIHTIFNVLLFCVMLGIIYKLANAGGFLIKNPYYRVIVNSILYIPCLFIYLIEKVTSLRNSQQTSIGKNIDYTYVPAKPYEIKILIVSLILLTSYFLWTYLVKRFLVTKYLTQGGRQLINQPISTSINTNVASYETLVNNTNTNNNYDYNYAISFWFFIDSFPPSTNASYTKIVPILSYGENPIIKYSSLNNTLYITVKQNNENKENKGLKQLNNTNIREWKQERNNEIGNNQKPDNIQDTISKAIENVKTMIVSNDVDADGHRIIYKQNNVLLQKWNQLVLNYNGGTLDIFYNGKLVKSAIEVVPYIKFDMLTVGTADGISGNIANLIYFDKPLDILTINTLYATLKDKNPPCVEENTDKLIP